MNGKLPVKKRTRRPPDERRREILDVARTILSKRGYQSSSLADIAASVGIVEGTIYKYFPTKRALLVAVLRDFYEPRLVEVARELGQIRGAENRLRFVITGHLRVLCSDTGLCRIVLRELRPDPALHRAAIVALNEDYTRPAQRVIEEGIASGALRADLNPVLTRDLLYGAMEHTAWRFAFGSDAYDVRRTANELADLVLPGIIALEGAETRIIDSRERVAGRLESRVGND
jgi:AcrR family transcriptional regulator